MADILCCALPRGPNARTWRARVLAAIAQSIRRPCVVASGLKRDVETSCRSRRFVFSLPSPPHSRWRRPGRWRQRPAARSAIAGHRMRFSCGVVRHSRAATHPWQRALLDTPTRCARGAFGRRRRPRRRCSRNGSVSALLRRRGDGSRQRRRRVETEAASKRASEWHIP